MKLGKTSKVVSLLLLASGMLAACSSNTSNSSTSNSSAVTKIDEKNLDGQYYSEKNSNGERMILEIDGKNILMTTSGYSDTGTIDTKKKSIKVQSEKITYQIIGTKLVLKTSSGNTTSFTKGTPPKDSKTSSSSKETEKTTTSTSSEKASELPEGTIKITATGDYSIGTDIPAGSYYFVLTEMNYSDDDTNKEAYVEFTNYKASTGPWSDFEMVNKVGKSYKLDLKEGGKLVLDDNYSPTSWTVALMTLDQYSSYKK